MHIINDQKKYIYQQRKYSSILSRRLYNITTTFNIDLVSKSNLYYVCENACKLAVIFIKTCFKMLINAGHKYFQNRSTEENNKLKISSNISIKMVSLMFNFVIYFSIYLKFEISL